MVPFKSFMCIMTLVHNVGITDIQFDPKRNNEMIITIPYDKWERFSNECDKGNADTCLFIAEHLSEFTMDPEKKECKMIYKF